MTVSQRPASRRSSGQTKRVRLDTDERRQQLLALGKAAFAERSYDEVSIDDIATAAGISKGLLYHYFPTKRDFYVAGLRKTSDELLARTTILPSDLPPIDRVRAGVDAYLDHIEVHGRAFVALMRGGIGSDPEVMAVLEDTRARLLSHILDSAGHNPIIPSSPGSVRLRVALRGWLGFVEATSIDWLDRRDLPRVELRDLIVEMLLSTVRAAMATRPG
jgi:AcrR family transcriptional regulator